MIWRVLLAALHLSIEVSDMAFDLRLRYAGAFSIWVQVAFPGEATKLLLAFFSLWFVYLVTRKETT